MNNMFLIGVSFVLIFMAYKLFYSYFMRILAGFVTIAAGIAQIIAFMDQWEWLIAGTVIVAVGIYVLLMVAYDLFDRED